MRMFLPRILVLDANFVLALRNTRHLDLLGRLRDLVLRAGLEVYVPSGVYAEVKGIDEHLAPLLSGFSKAVRVDRDEFFEKVRSFAVRNRYVSEDEYVDVEVMVLAAKLRRKGNVSVVTFDEGIIKTVRSFSELRDIEVIFPWSFLLRLIPFVDSSTKGELKRAIVDVYNYFYQHRVRSEREVNDLVQGLVEDSIMAMELSSEIFAELTGDLLLAIDKYLSGEKLSPQERSLVKEIVPLLDAVKLANSAESVEELEDALANVTSTLIMLGRELGRGKMSQLFRLACLLTSKSRFRLVAAYVERGEIGKAIVHLDFLRYLYVLQLGEVDLRFLSKIHTLMSLFCVLERKYEQSLKYLDVAGKIAPLDLHGKVTRLLICLAKDNVDKAEEILREIENEEMPVFNLLINFVHDFILRRQYEIAAKLLILAKKCKDRDNGLIEEKALILLKLGQELDADVKRRLEELVSEDMLRDHTLKPLDKKLLGRNISVSELHPTLKSKMIIMEHVPLSGGKVFLIVWNQALKSRLGIIVPRTLKEKIYGAMSITVLEGNVKRVKRPTPQEKKEYFIRGIIELSHDTQIEVEKWKIPIA